MQTDIAAAQAASLREWADQWERDAKDAHLHGGYQEIAFLLRRTAGLMTSATGGPAPTAGFDEMPRRREPVETVREG